MNDNIFLDKRQYGIHEKKVSINLLSKIVNTINQHTKINFDWSKDENLESLSDSDLHNILDVVSGHAQTKLVKILSPFVKPKILSLFGKKTNYQIRVSAQIKGRWRESDRKKNRKGKFINNIFYESAKQSNIFFPTRPHQDLDNNGFRSSHTLIFYFQLTGSLDDACTMKLGKIKNNTIGILENNSRLGYPNEITAKGLSQVNWDQNSFKPGEVGMMSGLVPHRTFQKSEVPRIALNIKIQPTDLQYLNLIYKYDLSKIKDMKNLENKLEYLYSILNSAAKKNKGLLFEKSITALLLGEKNEYIKNIRKLHLFELSKKYVDIIGAASLLRKTSGQIEKKDLQSLELPIQNIKDLSCAASIMNTIL